MILVKIDKVKVQINTIIIKNSLRIKFKNNQLINMLDFETLKLCKENAQIRDKKIKNIEHAIDQAEMIIKESKMSQNELVFLKRKISNSRQDLEILYLLKI